MKLNKRKKKKIIFIAIAIALLFSIYLNTFLIIKYNVLPFKYLALYFVVVALIPFLLIYSTVFTRIRPVLKWIYATIEVLYLIILFLIFFYLNNTFNFLEDFTSGLEYETKNYYVLALEDSTYKDINSLKNGLIGYSSALDVSAKHALDRLNKNNLYQSKDYEGYTFLLEDLYNKEINAVLIIQSYYDMLIEIDETIEEKTKIIYLFSIKEEVNDIAKDVDVTKESFNIYISGIDSYGSVTDTNRSDVNIVMSVNPKTNKIVLLNIPRDYYVTLAGDKDCAGQKDKLTHAGMYGVKTSAKTLENLLDIEINYYIKVNYSALINLVDALNGVNVYSKYEFTSGEEFYHFNKGYNEVNGRQALEFVRTRKAFTGGDRVRGENQQAMIQAIIKKACNVSILLKYDDILKSLEGSFTTNLSTDKIISLINMQLDKMPSWSMESISLDGRDSKGYTCSYKGQELYVMDPKEESVLNVKEILKNNN